MSKRTIEISEMSHKELRWLLKNTEFGEIDGIIMDAIHEYFLNRSTHTLTTPHECVGRSKHSEK